MFIGATYQGRKVPLDKPIRSRSGSKKFHVYVRDPKSGRVRIVRFGDRSMRINRQHPERRRSFRARHKCETAKDKLTARYWSCKMW